MKKIAIISGGSSGLGLSIAKQLVHQGMAVAVIGRRGDKLEQARNLLEEMGTGEILMLMGNVADECFVSELYASLVKDGYQIEQLYNCAGAGHFATPENTTRAMIDEVFAGSAVGLMLMSSYAIPAMRPHGGIIVNVMSSAALKGKANESVYCAAKWGARGYTEALKDGLKGSGIKVMGVYPGGMDTPFWRDGSGASPDVSRFMDPDEVATQVVAAAATFKTMVVSDITIDRL